MKEVKAHPLSEIFPLMPVSDIKELADDIKERGLQSAITLYDGKILDGRHRYEACQIAEIKPRFETYKGDDPLGFVIAANLKRRHLTTSQKAMVAASIENMPKHRPENKDANLHTSRSTAADSLDVSARSVATASKILDESPALAKQVNDGKISLHAAAEKLAEKKAKTEEQFDGDGFKIPEACLEYWSRGSEIQELLTTLSRVKVKLEKKRDEDDPLYRNISQGAINEIALAYSFIANAKPFAVCLYCQGKLKDSCRGCKGTGLMAKFAYEHDQMKGARDIRKAAVKKASL